MPSFKYSPEDDRKYSPDNHRKYSSGTTFILKQGRKRPLDTPKRMIERREREGKREKER